MPNRLLLAVEGIKSTLDEELPDASPLEAFRFLFSRHKMFVERLNQFMINTSHSTKKFSHSDLTACVAASCIIVNDLLITLGASDVVCSEWRVYLSYHTDIHEGRIDASSQDILDNLSKIEASLSQFVFDGINDDSG